MPGQTGGFYYKGSGPGGQPSQQQMQQQQPPMAGQGTQQAMSSNKWPYQQQLEEQQRQQQQQYSQQQPQIGAIGQPQQAQQQQHYGPLQHLQSQYGTAQAPVIIPSILFILYGKETKHSRRFNHSILILLNSNHNLLHRRKNQCKSNNRKRIQCHLTVNNMAHRPNNTS